MRIISAKKVVVLLALILCQLTIFAHIAQHAAMELDQSCQICLHAPGLNAGAMASTPAATVLVGQHEAPVLVTFTAPTVAVSRYYPIRAPPVLIV